MGLSMKLFDFVLLASRNDGGQASAGQGRTPIMYDIDHFNILVYKLQ